MYGDQKWIYKNIEYSPWYNRMYVLWEFGYTVYTYTKIINVFRL